MSIRPHRPGIWQVRVYRGYDAVTGKRVLDVRHVHGTETDARRVEAEMRGRPRHAEPPPAPLPVPEATVDEVDQARTVCEVIREAIDHLEVIGRAPKTIHDYRGIARGIEKDPIADMRIHELRPRDVDLYYGRLLRSGKTPERIRKYHSLLRTSAGWAVRWEWVDRNVVRDATPPTVHAKPVTAPETEVVAAVLAQVDRYDDTTRQVGVRLLGMLGCRRGEVCALRWSDIDWNGKAVRIHASRDETPGAPKIKATKTHQERSVPLAKPVLELLHSHRLTMRQRAMSAGLPWPDDAFVLSDAPDASVSLRPGLLTESWGRGRKRAKVGTVRLMDVRHWAATEMIRAGVEILVVSRVLGHADPATTRRFYAAATAEGLTAGADALGRRLCELGSVGVS